MSDDVYAKIEIGGPIPASELENLAEKLLEEGFDEGGPNKNTKEDWIKLIKNYEGSIIELSSYAVNYGMFSDLEEFLIENDISFIRESEASSEYDAEYAWHIHGQNKKLQIVHRKVDSSDIIIPKYVLTEILKALKTVDDLKKAPLHINEHSEIGKLSKYILKNGMPDPVSYIQHWLNTEYPDIPKCPPITIVENL